MLDIEQLQTIRSLALSQLAELRANPQPTYRLDGQTVSWESYAESLQRTVDWCDEKLAAAEPYEEQSRACI